MKYWIPNMVTSLNLVFGMLSILATFRGDFFLAGLSIVAAMVADGMDGRVARYFNVSSEFGKELDSLCDLVSFGVAPAIMAYAFMLKDFGYAGYFAAIFFATCGALRLARFNVNTDVVKGFFMGLPIPAGGCVLATLIMTGGRPEGWVFPILVMLFGYLMVSKVHYPDFKGKGEPLRKIPAALALALAVWALYCRPGAVLFAPFIAYVMFGLMNTVFSLFEKK